MRALSVHHWAAAALGLWVAGCAETPCATSDDDCVVRHLSIVDPPGAELLLDNDSAAADAGAGPEITAISGPAELVPGKEQTLTLDWNDPTGGRPGMLLGFSRCDPGPCQTAPRLPRTRRVWRLPYLKDGAKTGRTSVTLVVNGASNGTYQIVVWPFAPTPITPTNVGQPQIAPTQIKPTCIASCAGRQCGDNGCGGTCGTCATAATCVNGTCSATQSCGSQGQNCCTGSVCKSDTLSCVGGVCAPKTCNVNCCCLGACRQASFALPAGKTCGDCVAIANPNCSCGACCSLVSCN